MELTGHQLRIERPVGPEKNVVHIEKKTLFPSARFARFHRMFSVCPPL